jgi:ankyrin repeat protein
MRLVAALFIASLACATVACAREPKPMSNAAVPNDAFSNPDLAPLAQAVRRGDAAEIRRQLERVQADTPGSQGETLLIEAIRANQPDSVEALLQGGADPNRAGPRGETAVHAAAFSDNPELLRLVLAHGGDPDARNARTGETALMKALLSPEAGQYAVLLDAGADPNLADANGGTPLLVAARTNAGAAILRLLEKGASPLAQDSKGASFQSYYFSYRRELLNPQALAQRRQVVAWLKANNVPLEANVQAADD